VVEFVHQYSATLETTAGERYLARAYMDRQPGGLWEGWFVFFPLTGGPVLATDRETSQSKREDVLYWASGISVTYLEGALRRALERHPEVRLGRRIARAGAEDVYVVAETASYATAIAEGLGPPRSAPG
jgi:hypothetical protein